MKSSFHCTRGKFFFIVMLLVLLFPLIVLGFRIITLMGTIPFYPVGDNALIELATRDAATGERFLGLYSRFFWNHPGPLYFYLLTIPYSLSGEHSGAMHLGALIINIFALCGLTFCFWSFKSRSLFFSYLIVLPLFVLYIGPGSLSNPNTAFVTIIISGLFVTFVLKVLEGSLLFLPILIVLGSFLVQTHIGYSPLVVILSLWSFVFAIYQAFIGKIIRIKYLSFILIVSLLLFVSLWSLPLYEQFASENGNMSKIIAFFGENDLHSLDETLFSVAHEIAIIPIFLLTGMFPELPQQIVTPVTLSLAVLQVILLIGRSFFRTEKIDFAGALGIVLLIMSIYSVRHIKGEIHSYLTLWISFLCLLNWLFCVQFCWEKLRTILPGQRISMIVRFLRVVSIISTCILSLFIYKNIGYGQPYDDYDSRSIAKLSFDLSYFMESTAIHQGTITIVSQDSWPITSGIVLELVRSGHCISIDKKWLFMFGNRYAEDTKRDQRRLHILIGNREFSQRLNKRPEFYLISAAHEVYLYGTILDSILTSN